MPDGSRDRGPRAVRVRRSGIALVHEGELILPAAGSQAQADRVVDDDRAVIHYHFPVEIEVRGAPDGIDPEHAVRRALLRLAQGLENA
jgi:hypothetical protein